MRLRKQASVASSGHTTTQARRGQIFRMFSHHALEQLWPGHAKRRIVRTGGHTGWPRRGQITARVAKITVRRLQLANDMGSPHVLRIGHRNPMSFVRDHENAAVWTVFGAQAAPDAMILDHDLEVFASMNRIDGTSDHAMWIGAGPTRGRDHEVVQALPGAKQTRNRNPVRLRPMSLDATPRAGIATGAIVQVEDKNALTFVETLLDIVVENPVTDSRAVKASEGLFDDPATQDTKLPQHLKKIGAAELRQFQLIQRGTSRRAQPRWKKRREVVAGLLKFGFQFTIDFFGGLSFVVEGKSQ